MPTVTSGYLQLSSGSVSLGLASEWKAQERSMGRVGFCGTVSGP